MHDKLVKEDKASRNIPWFPIILVGLVGVIIVYGVAENRSQKRTRDLARRLSCGAKLHALGKAITAYAGERGGNYPVPDKWCDLLIRYAKATDELFTCPANKEQRCSFAINPKAEPNGPDDIVVLFETKGGWNQYGGSEMMALENHKKRGCYILFNDGHVEFVEAERIGELKW